MNNVVLALLVTIFAGSATLFGGIIACMFDGKNKKFLSIALSFSAGIMIYVSFVEIMNKGYELFSTSTNIKPEMLVFAFFMLGIIFMIIIDFLLPDIGATNLVSKDKSNMMRVGLISLLVITLHNLPEGIITFFSTVEDPAVGMTIALAIFIHNVPEGIAIAAPIYHATNSKTKAILYSLVAGLAEPLGAVIAYLIFGTFISGFVLGALFSLVAGVMVYIAFDELLPASRSHGNHHYSMIGLFSGIFVMGLSLILI